MQRIWGRYNHRSEAVEQRDYHTTPQHWTTVRDRTFPIRGPYVEVKGSRGEISLYVSATGETFLYYSLYQGSIFWSEQKLALPGKSHRIERGQAVFWTPQGCRVYMVEPFAHPPIAKAKPIEIAIEQYIHLLLQATERRLATLPNRRVAIAQSGGIDSLMVTWALMKCGAEVVPMTACADESDWDYSHAYDALLAMGAPPPLPIYLKTEEMAALLEEAALALEDTCDLNLRMTIANILIARKCVELNISACFNGHMQDAIHGTGGLTAGQFALVDPTLNTAEQWRDVRMLCCPLAGLDKLFAAALRRYGIQVRTPWFDHDLAEWVFSQPPQVIPVNWKKPFAIAAAKTVLPSVREWGKSPGYPTGAGFYRAGFRESTDKLVARRAELLKQIKGWGHERIAGNHAVTLRQMGLHAALIPDP